MMLVKDKYQMISKAVGLGDIIIVGSTHAETIVMVARKQMRFTHSG